MALAIFDLDNTLLAGDSDYLWGQYLCDIGVVDRDHYERENQRFYDDYRAGRLDIHAFLKFSLRPLAEHDPVDLLAWRERFIDDRIRPLVTAAGTALVSAHRDAGDTLLIITATNGFVTAPIAKLFGVDNLIATEPEFVDGRYTGAVSGIPSFRDGKVARLEAWLSGRPERVEQASFYSDSSNDLPLLERVGRAVAVDPDPGLRRTAAERGWPIISLRA